MQEMGEDLRSQCSFLNPIICFLFVKFKEIYDPLVIPRSLILIERDNFLDYREEMRSDSC